MPQQMRRTKPVFSLIVFALLLSLASAGLASAFCSPAKAVSPDAQLFQASGELSPDEVHSPGLPVYSTLNVNLRLTIPAVVGDGTMALEFTDGSGATAFTGVALDGETLWASVTLEPGTNVFELRNESGPVGPDLEYELQLFETEDVPVVWEGQSLGAGTWRSDIRLNFPTSGLYEFRFEVLSGRYQFLVDSDYIQKTAEASGVASYYLEAGVHSLRIDPDPGEPATAWSLEVSGPGDSADSLPYDKDGGMLGGTGNPFTEEWLPLRAAPGGPANFELALTGDPADGLVVQLYDGPSLVGATPLVYGGETFWWSADLAGGINRLRLGAESGNVGQLGYELTVHDIPQPTATWSGAAKAGAGNSTVLVEIPVSATYRVTLDTPTGAAQVLIDSATRTTVNRAAPLAQSVEFDVPLSAGNHSLQIVQAATYAHTDWTLTVAATSPGPELAHLTGALDPGEGVLPQIPLFGAEDKEVNLRLEVVAGADTSLALTVWDGEGGEAFAGTALSGEIVWATAVLKPGQNEFQIQNTGTSPLSYDLTVYEVGAAPHTWAGNSRASGTWDSGIKLDFPSDGIYQFDWGVGSGRYQLLVDEDYVQKTAEVDGLVSYYVPAGRHVVTILPDRATGATWSLDVSDVGAPADTLPYSQAGGALWSQPARFNEEWLPLSLAAATAANFELTLSGGSADVLDVHIYAGAATVPAASLTGVHGGETLWWAADLPAGVSRIQLVAGGANAAALSYDLSIYQVPEVSLTSPGQWAGLSYGPGNHSQWRFRVDTAGLYEFRYSITSGRYQFQVSSDPYLQKTVEVPGTARYYLDAGNHALSVIQDTAQGADWSLEIAATGVLSDALPLQASGGDLGGAGNDFDQEWWPLHLTTGTTANFELRLAGDLADGLVVRVLQGGTAVYTSPTVYGGETFWWTADLIGGTSVVELTADGANAQALAYDLSVHTVPTVVYGAPQAWSGISKGVPATANSEVELQIPVTGTYHVTLDMPHGFATMQIEPAPNQLRSIQQAHIEFDIPLAEGGYLFRVLQSSSYLTTTWTATVTLKSALPPEVHAVSPPSVTNDTAHILIVDGANLQPGATVSVDGTTLGPVTWLNSKQLQAALPSGFALGLHDLTVTNPDAQSATLPEALEVRRALYYLYLPMVAKANP